MDKNNRKQLLLFDLDDTLLRSDKSISERTLEALRKCRNQGILIGISTSRAVHNCMTFLPELTPDLFIAMGNAIDSVKEAADIVIGSNDEDGIAKYLEQRSESSF